MRNMPKVSNVNINIFNFLSGYFAFEVNKDQRKRNATEKNENELN